MDRAGQRPGAELIVRGLMMMKMILMAFAVFAMNTVSAVEVAGVRFDDQVRLGQSEVVANGAGMRKMAIFRVYAIAIYLPEKVSEAEAVLSAKGSKRVSISLLRDVTAQQFVDGLRDGMTDNHSEAEMATLKDRVNALTENMLTIGQAKTGTLIFLDWFPDSGTRLTVNGQVIGKDISGEDFYKAILKIWLGHRPVQSDLKQALLGKLS